MTTIGICFLTLLWLLQKSFVLCFCDNKYFFDGRKCQPCRELCQDLFKQTLINCSQEHDVLCGPCLPGYVDKGLQHCSLQDSEDDDQKNIAIKPKTKSFPLDHHMSTVSADRHSKHEDNIGIFLFYACCLT